MKKYCKTGLTTLNIEGTGDCHLCTCPTWYKKSPIGNWTKNSIEEIFNGDYYDELVETFQDQSFSNCNRNLCPEVWNLKEAPVIPFEEHKRLPTVLFFQDLDSTCNLQCQTCRKGLNYSKEVNSNAEFILNQVIEEYRDFEHPVLICGDGNGEMFASKAYMNFLTNPDIPECFNFAMSSNGTLFNKNIKLIESLKDRITGFTVTFDAATPETYLKTRGHDFEQMISGVKKVLDLGINIVSNFVVQKDNYHEIMQYKNLADELGVTWVNIQAINRWEHMTNDWWAKNRLQNNPDIDMDLLVSQVIEFTQAKNVNACGGLQMIVENYNKKGLNGPCG